jgi:tetratricopeptide (TPR) repeat protein
LIRAGVTGVSGHVAEPYLANTVRPEILFPAYLSGFNLAEAYYLAMPALSWQNIVIGDPLCAPFRDRPMPQQDIDPGVDERTGLPRFFEPRRITTLKTLLPGASDEAVALVARAGTLLIKGDRAATRAALEQATKLAPQAAYAHLQLGVLYDLEGKFDESLLRYRRVVELQPRNAVALNNLAYALATRHNAAAEALPFAQRALAIAPQTGAFIDTVAWIEHLQGNDAAAARRIASAVRVSPGSADVRLHAAIINAAAGARAVAEQELQVALRLQPTLEDSSEVKQLRERLRQLAAPAP